MSNGIDLITLALARKGGGGGTSDYTQLRNLPKINGTTVTGDLDADALGLANFKYYTLVIDETNKFVDADGTELAIANVYLDMLQFVSEDKSNLAVINVTFADEDEETGHTSVFGKLMYTGIDTDEGGLQFYARLGNVEVTVLVTEDEATFKQRDVDFVVRGILTMTSETTATIGDLTADYDYIKEAIDSGSNVKLITVANGNTVIEFNNVTYGVNSSGNYIQFDASSLNQHCEIVFFENGYNSVKIINFQPKYIATTVTLASVDWSSNTQTVNVSGITSTALVQVSPVASDVDKYASAKIVCTAQGNGTLTFTCGSVPTSNLTVTVVNWG